MNADRTLQLVDNHRRFLAFLERRLGDRALAEDILQDAFVKSLQKGEDVRDETSSVAWFYRTLRNAVIDHYRRTGARTRALASFAHELGDAVEPPPEMHDEICGCVTRLASTLKPEYEAAILRIDVEGVSVQDSPPKPASRRTTPRCASFAHARRCENRSGLPAAHARSTAAWNVPVSPRFRSDDHYSRILTSPDAYDRSRRAGCARASARRRSPRSA